LQRKRRYPLKLKRNKVSQIYQPAKVSANFSVRKWGKFFLYLLLTAVFVFIIKIIYDKQNVPAGSFKEMSVESEALQPPETPVSRETAVSSVPPFQKNIQIEILNACGVNGIAKIFTEYLQQQGFDVVNTENYREKGRVKWNLARSKIIDKSMRSKYAERVAEVIGIPLTAIENQKNLDAISDVSVVIGMDFRNLKGFQQFKK
jgi:hypothetical protein